MGLQVTPIGFESLGVRPMCSYVQTSDVRILIDAGVALGPRFGKLPHPREYIARAACRARIREYAAKADVIITSHYHNDHHTPNSTKTVWLGSSEEEAECIYKDKLVLMKDVRNLINLSQRRRGWLFQRFIKRIGGKCEVADGKKFQYGSTMIRISPPRHHGEEQGELGWVVTTTIMDGVDKLLRTSDVQGPVSRETALAILSEEPGLIILSGPPLYLECVKAYSAPIQKAIQNASEIAENVRTVIFEHHVLRSEGWREKVGAIYDAGERAAHSVMTAAEFNGMKPELLESIRQRLYEEEPPTEEFLRWTKLPQEKRRKEPPPL